MPCEPTPVRRQQVLEGRTLRPGNKGSAGAVGTGQSPGRLLACQGA
jgi:hypothetical protein